MAKDKYYIERWPWKDLRKVGDRFPVDCGKGCWTIRRKMLKDHAGKIEAISGMRVSVDFDMDAGHFWVTLIQPPRGCDQEKIYGKEQSVRLKSFSSDFVDGLVYSREMRTPDRSNAGREAIYPWHRLEKRGDGFFVDNRMGETVDMTFRRMSSAAKNRSRVYSDTGYTLMRDDDGTGVWVIMT